ncbi:MAG: glycosyl hydrolase, partial [Gemmatimonadota bacterium]
DDDDDERGGGRGEPPTAAGTNRFSWDLRHAGPTTFPDMIMWSAGSNGPRALPGRYMIRLKVDDRPVLTQSFEYRLNPRAPDITLEDVQAQHELAMRVRDAASAANEGVVAIRDVTEQVEHRIEQDGTVEQSGDVLTRKLGTVEEELYQVRNRSNQDPLNYPIRLNNRIAALLGVVEGVPGRPTRQSYQVFDELNEELRVQLDALHRIINDDLNEFNALLRSKGLEPVIVPGTRPIT